MDTCRARVFWSRFLSATVCIQLGSYLVSVRTPTTEAQTYGATACKCHSLSAVILTPAAGFKVV